MTDTGYIEFQAVVDHIGEGLLEGRRVEVSTWQALDVRDKPQGATIERTDVSFVTDIPDTSEQAQAEFKPNLPWAENQFQERVSGEPLNPGETFREWPWYRGNVEQHKEQGQFSHTYMERYWPKGAGGDGENGDPRHIHNSQGFKQGIRFAYGDLGDVVNLLAREPTTRQAYLPVFFPEDTGAVHGERIPCSLGYLFLMRENKLNITYYIRSCDFYRHFRDDVYMTARLCQWVLDQLVPREAIDEETEGRDFSGNHPWSTVTPGRLTMHIGSLHVFEGDLPKLRREYGS